MPYMQDLPAEVLSPRQKAIIVGDLKTGWDKDCEQLREAGINYVFSLKRGSSEIKECIPDSFLRFGPTFSYCGKAISCCRIPKGTYDVFVYLDYELLAEEMGNLYSREERHVKRPLDSLSSPADSLESDSFDCPVKPDPETGTFALKTSLIGRTGEEIFLLYKQWALIEQSFRIYDDMQCLDSFCMPTVSSEEGWLFLDHLSACMRSLRLENIAPRKVKRSFSFPFLARALAYRHHVRTENSAEYN